MDEKVLDALTDAAMLPRTGGDSMAQDLRIIRDRMEKAADTSLAKGEMKGNPTMARFLRFAAMSEEAENEIPLREDVVSVDESRDHLTAQSKRYEALYTTVPRIV